VQRVLVVQSALSAPAASDTQAYVSVSHGKQRALVLTDSKASLLEAVARRDSRISASEFARRARRPLRQRLRNRILRLRCLANVTRQRSTEIEHQQKRGMAR
jgi:hypothetical protein